MRVLHWCLAIGCFAACAPAPLSRADRSAIDASEQRLRASVVTADWASLTELYADSAALLPPDTPALVGRDAILSWFSMSGLQFDTFETPVDEIDGTGSLAYVHGTYLLTAAPSGTATPVRQTGKYVRVWRRQASDWRVVADIWNADAADAPAPAPNPASALGGGEGEDTVSVDPVHP